MSPQPWLRARRLRCSSPELASPACWSVGQVEGFPKIQDTVLSRSSLPPPGGPWECSLLHSLLQRKRALCPQALSLWLCSTPGKRAAHEASNPTLDPSWGQNSLTPTPAYERPLVSHVVCISHPNPRTHPEHRNRKWWEQLLGGLEQWSGVSLGPMTPPPMAVSRTE